ncbi:ABC transporter permease [Pendulispora albinea]|uniref:ABC transporter permease n=1 Tax=Pendulispora albinea TaxID=2741071 RepID=A0ABZ2MB28_9BACT
MKPRGEKLVVFKLAWRSLWRNKRRTLITLSSIALGLAFAVFFASFVTGMHKRTIGDMTRMLAGHITVEHAKFREDPAAGWFVPSIARVQSLASTYPEIEIVKPIVLAQAMVSVANGSSGAVLMGVDPRVEAEVSLFAHRIVKGRYLAPDDAKGVLIGKRLSERLKLDLDSKVVLTTVDAHGESSDTLLRVIGIFETASDEIDLGILQVTLATAQKILALEPDQATQVGLVLSDWNTQTRVLEGLRRDLAGPLVSVRPWQDLMPQIASWLLMSGTITRVLGIIIIVLVTATILNTILMSVLERSREFAVLLALGTPPRLLRSQVMTESIILGILGSAAGALLGGGCALFFATRGIDLAWASGGEFSVGGFAVDLKIRTYLDPSNLVFLAVMVFVFTVMAGVWPAVRSTRIDLARALRLR